MGDMESCYRIIGPNADQFMCFSPESMDFVPTLLEGEQTTEMVYTDGTDVLPSDHQQKVESETRDFAFVLPESLFNNGFFVVFLFSWAASVLAYYLLVWNGTTFSST